jgi:alanyl-tRNA synthetase
MTTRLYYTDATLRSFEAGVVSCAADGDRWRVVLDRTAFYPTSGGQPFDTGRLGSADVIDVVEDDDGSVVHVTTAWLEPGRRVRGEIDWPRRFDHMQQHTGQHLLSAVFAAQADAATLSFHMGAEAATIDLERELAPDAIAAIETRANCVVWENRAVRVRVVSENEARQLPLRKVPARTGDVRLVEIDTCDLSACGGTHVSSTGMIGMIAVTAFERFKGGTRVTFVCGGRALRSHTALKETVLGATRVLSVAPGDVVAGIERLQREVQALARTARSQQEALLGYRAADFQAAAETVGRFRVVLRADSQTDAATLKALAAAVTAAPGYVAVLAGSGQPAPLVVARSRDVELDAAALVRDVIAALGGRGGGRPESAQAGVPAEPAEILALVRQVLIRA